MVLQLAGLHELLCNNCGLEFKGFDPLRTLTRKPTERREKKNNNYNNHRRFPRYRVHLPATIALVERNPLTWDVSYSPGARGHCDMISQGGMALSFVGSRLPEAELTRAGCQLYVTVTLPGTVIAAVLSAVTCERLAANGQPKWTIGTKIMQMSDTDAARLAVYLDKRAATEPFVALGK